jgi:hypothetical protein
MEFGSMVPQYGAHYTLLTEKKIEINKNKKGKKGSP